MRGEKGGEWRILPTPSPQPYSELKRGNGAFIWEEEQEKPHPCLHPCPLLPISQPSAGCWGINKGVERSWVKSGESYKLEQPWGSLPRWKLAAGGVSMTSRVCISWVLAVCWLGICWKKELPSLPEPALSLQLLQRSKPLLFHVPYGHKFLQHTCKLFTTYLRKVLAFYDGKWCHECLKVVLRALRRLYIPKFQQEKSRKQDGLALPNSG